MTTFFSSSLAVLMLVLSGSEMRPAPKRSTSMRGPSRIYTIPKEQVDNLLAPQLDVLVTAEFDGFDIKKVELDTKPWTLQVAEDLSWFQLSPFTVVHIKGTSGGGDKRCKGCGLHFRIDLGTASSERQVEDDSVVWYVPLSIVVASEELFCPYIWRHNENPKMVKPLVVKPFDHRDKIGIQLCAEIRIDLNGTFSIRVIDWHIGGGLACGGDANPRGRNTPRRNTTPPKFVVCFIGDLVDEGVVIHDIEFLNSPTLLFDAELLINTAPASIISIPILPPPFNHVPPTKIRINKTIEFMNPIPAVMDKILGVSFEFDLKSAVFEQLDNK